MTTKSEICHTAKEQVAFELMKYIAEVEASEDQEKYHKPTIIYVYMVSAYMWLSFRTQTLESWWMIENDVYIRIENN